MGFLHLVPSGHQICPARSPSAASVPSPGLAFMAAGVAVTAVTADTAGIQGIAVLERLFRKLSHERAAVDEERQDNLTLRAKWCRISTRRPPRCVSVSYLMSCRWSTRAARAKPAPPFAEGHAQMLVLIASDAVSVLPGAGCGLAPSISLY